MVRVLFPEILFCCCCLFFTPPRGSVVTKGEFYIYIYFFFGGGGGGYSPIHARFLGGLQQIPRDPKDNGVAAMLDDKTIQHGRHIVFLGL